MIPTALYIHWPFCVSKCPYCDFNSHVRKTIDEEIWLKSYVKELERHRQLVGDREITSVFFGGGTPSLMSPSLVEGILNTIAKLWKTHDSIEITLEANPNSVEVDNFQHLGKSGVNRLSLGIQSLVPEQLTFLGRSHDVQEGIRAIETAKSCFSRVSFDLIYARPGQSLEAWSQELEYALSFETEHLSLYQLTIEPGTAFATRYARQDFTLPDENLSADLYQLTEALCRRSGLEAYEVSNYARPGCESRHNLSYWTYGDYMGVGPGAHGRITLADNQRYATRQYKAPDTWLTAAAVNATQESLLLDGDQIIDEMLLMGLRLNQPFDLKKLPKPWEAILNLSALDRLVELGFVTLQENLLQILPEGRLCLNEVLRQLRPSL